MRSNEITLPAGGGLLDTELELRFALQYPHYLKQWEAGNRLQVMLQRRKRYKNRTILGYKTLCSNTINMVAAVQRQMDMELELYGEATSTSGKETLASLARLQVQSLTSQPVDHEEAAERLKTLSLGDGAGIMNQPSYPHYILSIRTHSLKTLKKKKSQYLYQGIRILVRRLSMTPVPFFWAPLHCLPKPIFFPSSFFHSFSLILSLSETPGIPICFGMIQWIYERIKKQNYGARLYIRYASVWIFGNNFYPFMR